MADGTQCGICLTKELFLFGSGPCARVALAVLYSSSITKTV
jgi:hypothetical protein